ncbi:MAG TPA: serine/threonine-protein kinase, partial [Gemmataceae bacterium]
MKLTPEVADALAAELVGEMVQRWRRGERPLPEDFLARHPELWDHPEAAADLIYEEFCLRREYGPDLPAEDILARFPQWRPQLEVMLDCQRLLDPRRADPQFPAAGESLGDFLLLAEIGRGAHGVVFLASQLSLGDRPVVLKLTPSDAGEHLSLARLQHTHIVPLYSVQDHPARGLRALCMPYFGGATLARLLAAVRPTPPARRTGRDLAEALDREQAAAPGVAPARRQARRELAESGYVEAVCHVGACLADALQYAHDRGLVHLDLKPSNVLLAADGQPMVLDFHLARPPLSPAEPGPAWLGGTPGYMSPEQAAALAAARLGRPVPRPVDGRSDVYSLGVVLYEALAGGLPGGDVPTGTTIKMAAGAEPNPPAPFPKREGGEDSKDGLIGSSPPSRFGKGAGGLGYSSLALGLGRNQLHHRNPQVSVGLSDVIARCLADDPADRYPHMAALAADLRRHLAHRPLVGVRNRSLAERWRKWRRRRPHGAALAGMMLAVLTAAAAVALGAVSHVADRIDRAGAALTDARGQMAAGDWDAAIGTLRRGRAAAGGLPWQQPLAEELDRRLRVAEQGRAAAARSAAARDLHALADRVRFLYGADPVPANGLRAVAAPCRALWDGRERVVARLRPADGAAVDPATRDALYDLAIFWADVQVRLAAPAELDAARRQSIVVLDQAEALLGPSPVLDQERRLHGGPGRSSVRPPQTAWEYYALGRALLRAGELDRAAAEVGVAVRLEPQGLWPNFYAGLCAYRQGRYADAAVAYSVAIGAAPDAAACFFGRAVAL